MPEFAKPWLPLQENNEMKKNWIHFVKIKVDMRHNFGEALASVRELSGHLNVVASIRYTICKLHAVNDFCDVPTPHRRG